MSNSLLQSENYLNFLNNLELPVRLIEIIKLEKHRSGDMFGWQGLTSLTCQSQAGEIYDIDVRYAWSEQIFQQHLIDYLWNDTNLLSTNVVNKQLKHKIIIYLCEPSTNLNQERKLNKVSEHFIISRYWQTISHLYLQLPYEHPFDSQIDTNKINSFQQSYLVDYEPIVNNSENSHIKTLSRLPTHPKRKAEGGLRTKGLYKHSTTDKPLVTVATVVFNGDKYLEQTIQSVINQSYPNLEYIIIDGGSTDTTVDIIRKYENQIDYWVSEPDKGIYDAMNKSIQASTGEVIGLINSGDLYTNKAIEQIVKLYNTNDNLIISGAMYRFKNKGNLLFKLVKNQQNLILGIYKGMPINHPATFVTRKAYQTLGYFNPEFRICGDYDFIFRAYHSQLIKFIFTNTELACMRLDGVSEKFKSIWIRSIEHFIIRKQKIFWLTNILIFIHWLFKTVTKYLIKKIVGNKLMSIYYKFRHDKNLKSVN